MSDHANNACSYCNEPIRGESLTNESGEEFCSFTCREQRDTDRGICHAENMMEAYQ